MQSNFRFQLAKLLFIISAGIVLIIGLSYRVGYQALITRTLIGSAIFTTIGFILGMIIDKEKNKITMQKQKKKLQKQIKQDYEKVKDENDEDFEEMDVDQLTRLVIDSMDEDNDDE